MVHRRKSEISKKILSDTRRVVNNVGEGRILAAVSGGADSVAMLLALIEVYEHDGTEDAINMIEVANCNFHLRAEEADRDSEFVKQLCKRLGVRLHYADFNASDYAAEKKISLEMACRELRHGWFRELMEREGFSRLATGHNATDNIETMLLNMLRGSGTSGLRAMRADDGRIIRPLLNISRDEIRQHLKEISEKYVEDSSNAASDYRRNYLRNEILPMLESRWEGAQRALSKTLEILRRENQIVEKALADALREVEYDDKKRLMRRETISRFADPQTLIYRYIKSAGGTPTMAAEITETIAQCQYGKIWYTNQYLIINKERGLQIETTGGSQKIELKWEKYEIRESDKEEIWEKIKRSRPEETWTSHGPEAYELREWREGDRIKLLGMKGSRLCSDILKESGLTHAERWGQQVLIRREDGEIVWLIGHRRSRLDLITATSTNAWHCKAVAD
ncbi:MAG: tRNA lysidine(34) synthetase TilS [Clostridium sp.]|nr:tRNA lysidine(34) synthetase TilS [Prevotella sp.]MCM1428628.1 tRNA lysidine(34) synthetase TilS [Clostridium sp.]